MAPKRKRAPASPAGGMVLPAVFDEANVAQLKQSYLAATPYAHVVIKPLADEALLERARREAIEGLRCEYKETDLFKLYQVPHDLSCIEKTAPDVAKKAPSLLQLRDAIYSPAFRAVVRAVTGCGELSDRVDCSANVYAKGGHLLCHDDVIGTRVVSYIIYLTDPAGWPAGDGGAVELYDVDLKGEPLAAPCVRVNPDWNSMLLFRVQPGKSFHSVQEVYGDDPRLTISGWYHAVDAAEAPTANSSLSQLTALAAEGDDAEAGSDDEAADDGAAEADAEAPLAPDDAAALAEWVEPEYLKESVWASLRKHFCNESAVRLDGFVRNDVAAALGRLAHAADARDALGDGRAPDYGAGLGDGGALWRVVGPPHKQRYLELADDAAGAAPPGRVADAPDVTAALRALRASVRSGAFRRLLHRLVGVRATASKCAARRFRPGLDYTVAHSGGGARVARLDATLCFLGQAATDADGREDEAGLWETGDVGGFETYIAADDDADPDVYKSTHDDGEAGEGGDDGGDLLSVSAAHNTLSIVLRDPGTLRFVKYVSAAAPGSRYDLEAVCTIHPDDLPDPDAADDDADDSDDDADDADADE
ncbi:Oxoglutarate and iron-dependent oxygenase degradation C-term-domain-containing protein [Pelagophyceae sp. CCMP2097]|nr:Oxoglutarate and iron-dependent oxygenase degradation C-term-domain-containing protein [Pelagophyceae sp. CCMP2097]